jgi:hypothetical protein
MCFRVGIRSRAEAWRNRDKRMRCELEAVELSINTTHFAIGTIRLIPMEKVLYSLFHERHCVLPGYAKTLSFILFHAVFSKDMERLRVDKGLVVCYG